MLVYELSTFTGQQDQILLGKKRGPIYKTQNKRARDLPFHSHRQLSHEYRPGPNMLIFTMQPLMTHMHLHIKTLSKK